MKTVTLLLDDDLFDAGKAYAQRNGTSLDALISRLLAEAVRPAKSVPLDDCFARMDEAGGNSNGQTWRREELHDR